MALTERYLRSGVRATVQWQPLNSATPGAVQFTRNDLAGMAPVTIFTTTYECGLALVEDVSGALTVITTNSPGGTLVRYLSQDGGQTWTLST
jgi:hypothetical protein